MPVLSSGVRIRDVYSGVWEGRTFSLWRLYAVHVSDSKAEVFLGCNGESVAIPVSTLFRDFTLIQAGQGEVLIRREQAA